MGYLSSARGDYLGGYRGDPGIFGSIGRALGGIARTALGVVGAVAPGPIGIAARLGTRLLGGGRAQPILRAPGPPGVARFTGPLALGRGAKGGSAFGGGLGPLGVPGFGRKRRRMNPGNVRALRRAMRRQESFVKLARRALKGSKYSITTRGAARSRSHVHVRESGPGGVTVS